MKYKDFKPTQFDGHISLDDEQEEWYVLPTAQNRDSDPFTRSNFQVMQKILDEKSIEYEVHRFGHWANGWFEIILTPNEDIYNEITEALNNYPLLDDEHASELELEENQYYWDASSIESRIVHCKEANISIFAARREEIPWEVHERLR